MELEEILMGMSKLAGKSKTYLKGLYNTEMEAIEEKFEDAITDEQKQQMALDKVANKYKIKIEDITMTDKKPIAEIADDNPFGVQEGWAEFFASLPDPEKPTFEKTPALIIEVGPTYTLQMADPSEKPFTKEFDGKYGTYNKTAFKVLLIKASDEALYDAVYEKGDFEGKKCYVDGQKYTMWLSEKAAGYFKMFWSNLTEDGLPDTRPFTYKHSKKGNTSVYTFSEAKK